MTAANMPVTTATTDDDGPGRRLGPQARPAAVNGASRVYARKWLEFYKIAPGLAPWLWWNVRRFDVIHIHALFSFTSVATAIIARLRGVPYIVRPLGTLTTYGVTRRRPWLKRLSLWLIEARILRHAAAVHFTSCAELKQAASLGAPFHGVVIPLGVEQCPPGDERLLAQEHPVIEGRRIILFLSRIDPKKNLESLLRAVAMLVRKGERPILLIAGEGSPDYAATLETLAKSLEIEGDIIWLGHVEGARKAAAFAAAEVFVLPSFSENFGIAAVEALLAGLPCVLGQGVAIADDARDAGAGLAIAPEPATIAAALEKILGDDALRRAMGIRGKAFAAREYSPRAMGERLIALYENIRSSRPREVA